MASTTVPTALLTVAEVAEQLRVSGCTVRRIIRAGHLPGVRIGVSLRVDRTDLAAYLAAHRTPAHREGA